MSASTTSERSIVTVVAADVVGSTNHVRGIDPDDALAFVDHCFEEFKHAVEAFGGRLISYAGDGGIAIFGWPEALEDHADRACAAAWLLQHPNHRPLAPSGLPVSLRLGVHSGRVAGRHLDQPGRSGWNAVGDVVHMTAKLQQSAPIGGILVSAETLELCRSTLTVSPAAGDADARGSGLRAFHLRARPDLAAHRIARRYSTPLVGRDRELQWLREHVLAADEETRVVSVVGEAGIGKSRIADALSGEAANQGWRTLAVYGDAQTRASPFAVALAMTARLLGLPQDTSLSAFQDALELKGVDQETSSLLCTLFEGGVREGSTNQMHIARAFVRVLLNLERDQPLLLLVEDLHLVDLESQSVLRLLVPEQAVPVLSFLVTGRPEGLRDVREIGGALIELQPLAPADMHAIAHRICPEGTPMEVLERVVARADGIVFVLEEFARSIGSNSSGADLPPSVESAIHARLGHLSREAKDLAQALCLLGEHVELDLLRQVAAVQPDQLMRLLAELERFAFVDPPGGTRAGFRHHILAEACANTISRPRRINLHGAALKALQARPDAPGQRLRLATHAEGAGNDMQALSFLWEAAMEARGTSAAASLNLIFDRALAMIGRIGEAAAKTYVNFVLMAFPSMLLLGEFAKMGTHLPKVMELARAQQRPDKVSNSLSQFGMLCWFEGRYEEGRRATEEGRRIARELELPALIYSNQLMLANVLHGMGRIDLALAELVDLKTFLGGALASARWGAPTLPLSTTLSFIGWIKADTDQLEDSLEHSRLGLEIARRERDAYAEIMARNALGRAFLHMGRNEEAASCLQVAWDLAEAHGYDATKSNLAGHMASAFARLGRADEAISIAESCFARRLHLRTGCMENVLLRTGHAEAVACAGDLDHGLALLDEALEIAVGIGNPCLLARGLDLRAAFRARVAFDDPRVPADHAAAADQRRRISGAKHDLA